MEYSQLDRPVQYLKGVGPKRAEAFARIGIDTARDLLYHVPRRYDDASTVDPIGSLSVGMDATVLGRVRTKGVIPTGSGLHYGTSVGVVVSDRVCWRSVAVSCRPEAMFSRWS